MDRVAHDPGARGNATGDGISAATRFRLEVEAQRANQAMVHAIAQLSAEDFNHGSLKKPVSNPDPRPREQRRLRTGAELKRDVGCFETQQADVFERGLCVRVANTRQDIRDHRTGCPPVAARGWGLVVVGLDLSRLWRVVHADI